MLSVIGSQVQRNIPDYPWEHPQMFYDTCCYTLRLYVVLVISNSRWGVQVAAASACRWSCTEILQPFAAAVNYCSIARSHCDSAAFFFSHLVVGCLTSRLAFYEASVIMCANDTRS